MRLSSLLDYRQYRSLNGESALNNTDKAVGTAKAVCIYRFSGNIESITDGHTLWVRGDDLTLPISLEKTKCYLLPKHEEGEPDAPSQIKWNRVSTLSEGIKVFVGGEVCMQKKRLSFCSTKENPLTVIFYSCPDSRLTEDIIRAARTKGEYWNSFTPISIVTGALSLFFIAATYLDRPAFHLAVICSLVAVFIPVYPVLPPGFLITFIYQRIAGNARKMRINCDLAYFNLLPGAPENTAKRYAIRAYSLEALAWVLMLLGICINIVFIFMILFLFNVVSF